MLFRLLPLFLLLSSCASLETASPPVADAVRLVAEQPRLRAAAERILRQFGARLSRDLSTPAMRVRESSEENVESVGVDGSPNFYAVQYRLSYQFNEGPWRHVLQNRIVSHDESRYLAERKRRRAVLSDLRQRALQEMMFRLGKESANTPANIPADSASDSAPDSSPDSAPESP